MDAGGCGQGRFREKGHQWPRPRISTCKRACKRGDARAIWWGAFSGNVRAIDGLFREMCEQVVSLGEFRGVHSWRVRYLTHWRVRCVVPPPPQTVCAPPQTVCAHRANKTAGGAPVWPRLTPAGASTCDLRPASRSCAHATRIAGPVMPRNRGAVPNGTVQCTFLLAVNPASIHHPADGDKASLPTTRVPIAPLTASVGHQLLVPVIFSHYPGYSMYQVGTTNGTCYLHLVPPPQSISPPTQHTPTTQRAGVGCCSGVFRSLKSSRRIDKTALRQEILYNKSRKCA